MHLVSRPAGIPRLLLPLLLLCLFTLSLPVAYGAPATYRIELPTRTLEPADDGGAFLLNRSADRPEGMIVQLRGHLSAPARRALAADGVLLHEYIGGGAWAALVQPDVDASTLSAFGVRWAGPLLAEDKLHARVVAGETPTWAQTTDGTLYAVAFFKGVDDVTAEEILRNAGATPGAQIPAVHTWHALGDAGLPARLAADARVLHVGFISPPLESLNEGVREAMNVDPLHQQPYDLSGEGEVVCVYDGDAADPTHPDFGNRMTQIEAPTVINDHPTHVSGTVGGNGDDAHRGVAPGVTLLSMYYSDCNPYCLYDSPNDIHDDYQLAYTQYNARTFNNSIGANISFNGYDCDWLGDYEVTSALLDSLVRGPFGEPMNIVWAAGNERAGDCGSSYGTISVPSSAKNPIVVGATTDNDNMTTFSSWGPTDDGRVKPDVVAPGNGVSSCAWGGGYTTMSGTSMATPAVSGTVALLLEAWHRINGAASDPLPETVKAILVNTADDLGNPGPDYVFGHGRVNAFRAINSLQYPSVVEGEVDEGDLLEYSFTVPEGTNQLSLTLAWSDAPAGYLPAATLVNDLNLALRNPDGENHLAWRLNPDNVDQPALRGINSIDNVETVEVTNPIPGSWTILVQGLDVPVGPQSFGLSSSLPIGEGFTRVQGQVNAAGGGGPLAGVEIRIDGQGGEDYVTYTSATGGYLAWVQLDGDRRITASMPGYLTQNAWVIDQGQAQATVNFTFFPGAMGTVGGVVRDSDGDPVGGADIEVVELPDVSTTSNANGVYMLDLPTGERYTLQAVDGSLMDVRQVFLEPDGETQVDFLLAAEQYQITGPDTHGYLAIQNGDNHPLAPDYDWIEIDPDEGGPGTRIPTSVDDTPIVIELPWTFTYYGEPYGYITVNENGMFAFGDLSDVDPDTAADYSNEGIPDEDGPGAMVAPFWEDFRASETNLSYHDDGQGRFILEWFDSRQWPTDGTRETFQVILFDTADFPTGGDDGKILFQYADVNDIGNATVGIEDHTETDGIEICYFMNDGTGDWAPTAQPITDGSAVLFVHALGVTGGVAHLDPPDDDVTITATLAGLTTTANGSGLYQFDSAPFGLHILELSAPGYETIRKGVELFGEPVIVPPTTLHLLTAPDEVVFTELNGDPQQGAAITWNYAGGEADDFLGQFRVYRDGLPIAQTAQLAYDDTEPLTPDRQYWVTALFDGGESDSSMHAMFVSDVAEALSGLPWEFDVSAAWPNPFNPATAVTVSLPQTEAVTVAVHDLLGREVVRLMSGDRMDAGRHRLSWDATGHASGMYFISVRAGQHHAVRKVLLLK